MFVVLTFFFYSLFFETHILSILRIFSNLDETLQVPPIEDQIKNRRIAEELYTSIGTGVLGVKTIDRSGKGVVNWISLGQEVRPLCKLRCVHSQGSVSQQQQVLGSVFAYS